MNERIVNQGTGLLASAPQVLKLSDATRNILSFNEQSMQIITDAGINGPLIYAADASGGTVEDVRSELQTEHKIGDFGHIQAPDRGTPYRLWTFNAAGAATAAVTDAINDYIAPEGVQTPRTLFQLMDALHDVGIAENQAMVIEVNQELDGTVTVHTGTNDVLDLMASAVTTAEAFAHYGSFAVLNSDSGTPFE